MNPRIIGSRAGDGPRHARPRHARPARYSPGSSRRRVRLQRRIGMLAVLAAIPTATALAEVADHPLGAQLAPTLVPMTPPAAPEVAADATTMLVTARAGETIWAVADRSGAAPGAILRHNRMAAPSPGSSANPTGGDALAAGRPLERTRTLVVPVAAERQDVPAADAVHGDDSGVAALDPVFDRWADHFGVPRDLLKAIAWVESGWENDTRSPGGGIGIGRLQPARAQYLARHVADMDLDPAVAVDNIALTAAHLRVLLDETPDVRSAVAAHRQGITDTRLSGVDPMLDGYVEAVLAACDRFA